MCPLSFMPNASKKANTQPTNPPPFITRCVKQCHNRAMLGMPALAVLLRMCVRFTVEQCAPCIW